MKLSTLILLLNAAHKIGFARGQSCPHGGIYEAIKFAEQWGHEYRRHEDIGALLARFATGNPDSSSEIV